MKMIEHVQRASQTPNEEGLRAGQLLLIEHWRRASHRVRIEQRQRASHKTRENMSLERAKATQIAICRSEPIISIDATDWSEPKQRIEHSH
jgi:hypothetical protein